MSAIALQAVSKHWATPRGDVHAVRNLSFALEQGTLNVLLGPSGCGKSTTLRIIAGLETADAGSISIGGCDVTRMPPAQRNISMVFQSYALFPHLDVGENIVFGLRVRKVSDKERNRRLSEVAGLLGLSTLLDRKPGQLSGGQQQRVALGRAIIGRVPVCLMDEPLSNLDAQLRAEMRSEIRALQRTLGITMVYVTHDQVEAMSMADRVILLNRGEIEQNGMPVDLYETPANTFVARFIGTPPMNLLPLVAWRDGAVIKGTDGPVVLPAQFADGLLGVRPEHIRVQHDGEHVARVEGVEYLGGDSLIACKLGETIIAVRQSGAVGLAGGDVIRLAWTGGAQHCFDVSGARVRAPEPYVATMLA